MKRYLLQEELVSKLRGDIEVWVSKFGKVHTEKVIFEFQATLAMEQLNKLKAKMKENKANYVERILEA